MDLLNKHNPRNSRPKTHKNNFDLLEDWVNTEGLERFISCLDTTDDDKFRKTYLELLSFFKSKPKAFDNLPTTNKKKFTITVESPNEVIQPNNYIEDNDQIDIETEDNEGL